VLVLAKLAQLCLGLPDWFAATLAGKLACGAGLDDEVVAGLGLGLKHFLASM